MKRTGLAAFLQTNEYDVNKVEELDKLKREMEAKKCLIIDALSRKLVMEVFGEDCKFEDTKEVDKFLVSKGATLTLSSTWYGSLVIGLLRGEEGLGAYELTVDIEQNLTQDFENKIRCVFSFNEWELEE